MVVGGDRSEPAVPGGVNRLLESLKRQPLASDLHQRQVDPKIYESIVSESVRSSSAHLCRDGLRAVFYVGGLVATTAGLHTVVVGARSLPGQEVAHPSVESELRFYAAFYLAYGIAALRVAPRADRDSTAVRALAGVLFLAGLARAGGWLAAGRPHRLQRGLLVIELAGPPLITAWQARLAARS
jgi:hypothetical protein